MSVSLLLSLLLSTLVFAVFFGPWVALTRSMATLSPATFVEVTHRMDRNLAPLMTVLFPLTLVAIVATLVTSFVTLVFWLTLAALVLLVLTLIVTTTIEVPIVARIREWSAESLPDEWQKRRDRWVSFHLARVIPGFLAVALLATAAVLA